MSKIDIFSTPPLDITPSIHILNESQLSKIKNYDFEKAKDNSVSKNIDILNDPIFEDLRYKLDNKVNEYMKNILMINDKVSHTNSWVAVSKKGESHHNHNHPGAFISLIYYVKCNSGDLIFTKNSSGLQEGFNFSYNVEHYNSYNSRMWTISVRTGDLVILPGWINHETSENLNDDDRVIIGANYFLTGSLGKSLDEVKV